MALICKKNNKKCYIVIDDDYEKLEPETKKVTPKKNMSDRELTLKYLKNEYRRLYFIREEMIKNNNSKEEIKKISDKMEEVCGHAYRIEIGEDTSYDIGMSMRLRK